MTDEQIREIEERLKLVPGPLEIDDLSTDILGPEDEWGPEDSGGACMIHGIPHTQVEEGWYFTRYSALFFANTPLDISALLAHIKALTIRGLEREKQAYNEGYEEGHRDRK